MNAKTLWSSLSIISLVVVASVSAWRAAQPIPAPVYKESGGQWKIEGVAAMRPNDLTVGEVALRESRRLGRFISAHDVELAISMKWLHPEPVKIESQRVTYRITSDYKIEWPENLKSPPQ